MEKILVTGGGGFLGGAIVKQLVERNYAVRSFSRGAYPGLSALGVEQIQGDLADAEAVEHAVTGVDAIIHTAAKPGVWGSYASFYEANVKGSRNIILACRNAGVNRLVYTSSPSVTFAGEDQQGVNESAPYPKRFLAFYPQTKAEAERLVLRANDQQLASVALRPHLIWGPQDNHLVPRVIQRAKAGKLRIVGDGAKLVDAVYVDNAAHAHILALEQLRPSSPISGRAYFITNDEPMPMAAILNGIVTAAGLPPVTGKINATLAYFAGAALEATYRLLRKQREPMMTRFVALQLSTAHWFDISAAKRDLDYQPRVGMQEGFARLKAWLQTPNA